MSLIEIFNGDCSTKFIKGINGNYFFLARFNEGIVLCVCDQECKLIKTDIHFNGVNPTEYDPKQLFNYSNNMLINGYYKIDNYIYFFDVDPNNNKFNFKYLDMLKLKSKKVLLDDFKWNGNYSYKVNGYIYAFVNNEKIIIMNIKTLEYHQISNKYQCHNDKYVVMTNNRLIDVFDVISQKMIVNALPFNYDISSMNIIGDIVVITFIQNAQTNQKKVYILKLKPNQPKFGIDIKIKLIENEIILSTIKNIFDKYECKISNLPKSNIIDTVEKLYEMLMDALNGICGDNIWIEIENNDDIKLTLVINYKYLVERHNFNFKKVITNEIEILNNKINYIMKKIDE